MKKSQSNRRQIAPALLAIDHVHVYVKNRTKAAQWYEDILGFSINKAFECWAEDKDGPLTLEDRSGQIHLALFQVSDHLPSSVAAYNTDGKSFLAWKAYLEDRGILVKYSDHKLSGSLYFNDLDNNTHEITTYDVVRVSKGLSA